MIQDKMEKWTCRIIYIGSAIFFIYYFAPFLFYLFSYSPMWDHKIDREEGNLCRLARAVNFYMLDYGGGQYLPPSQKTLFDLKLAVREDFISRSRGDAPIPSGFFSDFECILDQIGAPVKAKDFPEWMPLFWSKPGRFKRGIVVVSDLNTVATYLEKEEFDIYPGLIEFFVNEQKKKAALEIKNALAKPAE